MNKRVYIAVGIAFTCVCIILFHVFYFEARQIAIDNLNEIQRVQARQAAVGIESFFKNRTNSMIALSKMEDIIYNNAEGQNDLKLFYESHPDQITAITRMDEKGIIIYNFPIANGFKGFDISSQNHVKQILKNHKPVISDVFQSIEGNTTIAIHVPVFKGADFKGSIAVLIDFKSLAKHYFESIKIGQTGYAWVISRDGTQLYSPIPEFIGKPALENVRNYPSLQTIVTEMLKGKEGTGEFRFNKIGDKTVSDINKYSIYMPIHFGSTFWSINVCTSEGDILSDLNSFKNKLTLLLVILFIFGILFSIYGVKAWLIVNEEEKRKAAEGQLRKNESRFWNIFNNMQDAFFESDEIGVYKFISPSALQMFGYDSSEEIVGLTVTDLYTYAADRDKLLNQLEQKGKVEDFVCQARRKDGTSFWVSMNVQYQYNEKNEICGIAGVVRDITERKLAEEELIKSEARYRSIYDNALEGMYSTSMDGKVLRANNALAKILGYDNPEEIINTITDTESQIWGNPEERKFYMKHQKSTKVLKNYECRFKRKDGSLIWVSINSKLMQDESREQYFKGFIEDISERKNKELEIENKMKELQWYFDISMQRELKMADLKKEINELLIKAGKEKRYL